MKTTRKIRTIIMIVLCLAAFSSLNAQTVVIQIGTNMPANSPWDLGLKKIAAEWSKISGGKVKMVFPKSVSNSSMADLLQKMKFSIDGCVLETSGLGLIDKDVYYLSMPGVINNDAELGKGIDEMTKILRERTGDRYEYVAMAKAGWIYFFSNQEIIVPDDLKKVRMGVNRNMDSLIKLMQSMGVRTVNSDTASSLLQFNSNSLDAIYSSPLYIAALWSQYRKVITHISPFVIAPFFGSIVIKRSSWEKIPANLREPLRQAAEKICAEIGRDAVKLEKEGIATMKKNGLIVPPFTQADQAKWDALYADKYKNLGTMFSAEFINRINKAIGK